MWLLLSACSFDLLHLLAFLLYEVLRSQRRITFQVSLCSWRCFLYMNCMYQRSDKLVHLLFTVAADKLSLTTEWCLLSDSLSSSQRRFELIFLLRCTMWSYRQFLQLWSTGDFPVLVSLIRNDLFTSHPCSFGCAFLLFLFSYLFYSFSFCNLFFWSLCHEKFHLQLILISSLDHYTSQL